MGNGSAFRAGTFGEYVTVKYIAGVRVITKKGSPRKSENTPMYSHSEKTMYARRDAKTGKVTQIAVYDNHRKIKDIEWGHKHGKFEVGQVHVQEYIDGKRQPEAREPTAEELRLANKIMEADSE